MKVSLLLGFLGFFLISVNTSMAQLTGTVIKKDLGLEFSIPEGWVGQENNGVILLGSHTVPGMIILSLHEYKTVGEMKSEATIGFSDNSGTELRPAGDIEEIDSHIIGLPYAGKLEGYDAKAYVIGILNPKGYGVTIMAATNPENYSEEYRKISHQIANSLKFSEIDTSSLLEEWKQKLNNRALNYMSSYNSNDSRGYGGTSARRKISLCGNGQFSYSSSSSINIDVGGAFGNSSSKDSGSGSWNVENDGPAGAKLVLRFQDGRVWEYSLGINDKGNTILNGERYFNIGLNDPNGNGPDCY
ncbi:hypothetical protein [Aquiflexum sp.]|uniref:hypothetical protein n=1 Tax=Aquiflexum sp. TaxID=1872584 RepID=UPI003593157D